MVGRGGVVTAGLGSRLCLSPGRLLVLLSFCYVTNAVPGTLVRYSVQTRVPRGSCVALKMSLVLSEPQCLLLENKGYSSTPAKVAEECTRSLGLPKQRTLRRVAETAGTDFLESLEAGSLRPRSLQGWFLPRPAPLAYRRPSSPRVLVQSSFCECLCLHLLIL